MPSREDSKTAPRKEPIASIEHELAASHARKPGRARSAAAPLLRQATRPASKNVQIVPNESLASPATAPRLKVRMAYREEGKASLSRQRYVAIEVQLAQRVAARMAEASLARREAALRDRIARVKRSLAHAREGRTKRRSALVLTTVLAAGLSSMALSQRLTAPNAPTASTFDGEEDPATKPSFERDGIRGTPPPSSPDEGK